MAFEVNVALAEYIAKVNPILQSAAGVRYMDVYRDVYGDHVPAMRALDAGSSPEQFVSETIAYAGFVVVDEYGDVAKPMNLRIAALIPFSNENPHWLRANGGALVAPAENGIVRISPVMADPEVNDSWGFAIDRIENADAVTDELGHVVLSGDFTVERVANAIDINEAIVAYEMNLATDYGTSGYGR